MTEDNIAVSSAGAKTVTTFIHPGSSSQVIRARPSGLREPQTQGRVITNPLDTRPDMIHYHLPHSLDEEHYEVKLEIDKQNIMPTKHNKYIHILVKK